MYCGQEIMRFLTTTAMVLALLTVVFYPYLCRFEWKAVESQAPKCIFICLGNGQITLLNDAFTGCNEIPTCFQDQGFYQDLQVPGFNSSGQTIYTQSHHFHQLQ